MNLISLPQNKAPFDSDPFVKFLFFTEKHVGDPDTFIRNGEYNFEEEVKIRVLGP